MTIKKMYNENIQTKGAGNMDTNILLETGTNELELLEFVVGKNNYGINIAKVNEIMINVDITPVPNAPESIEGVFIPRDKLVSVIDLHKVLHSDNSGDGKNIYIVCNFNQMLTAFHVSRVKGIQRISWTDISQPPTIANGFDSGMATGVAKIDDRIIIILDFEKIVTDLNRSSGLDTSGITDDSRPDKITSNKHIIIADDSPFLNKMITSELEQLGYKNITSFQNGQQVWDYLQQYKDIETDITSEIACIISDIEMPMMDGHRLTKLIKDDATFKNIPVLLFSSLINDQMKAKGESVGADAQFSKPQINDLIKTLIKLLK